MRSDPDAASGSALCREFREAGYVLARGFVSPDGLAEIEARLAEFLIRRVPAMPRGQVYHEDPADPSTLKQLQQLGEHDPFFDELLHRSRFATLAAELLGEPAAGKNLQYFDKPPGLGRPTPPHQDGYYFHLEPNHAVTLWLPLDRTDAENGCVRYVTGSHRRGLRAHGRSGTLGFSQHITDWGADEDHRDEVAIAAEPGDLLGHHCLTVHRADGNRSRTRRRRALGFIYYAESAREDTTRAAEYQRRLAAELQSDGRI